MHPARLSPRSVPGPLRAGRRAVHSGLDTWERVVPDGKARPAEPSLYSAKAVPWTTSRKGRRAGTVEDLVRVDHRDSPGEQAEHNELLLRLAHALIELPEAQREAIVLRHYENWSLEAISQHLGRSPAAVAGLLHRGLKALRLRLQDAGAGGPES